MAKTNPMRALLLLALLASACVGELDDEGPCTDRGECRIGYQCVQGFCLQCEPGGCGLLVFATIPSNDDATLCNEVDACASFQRGSLSEPTEVFIRVAELQIESRYDRRSGIFEIGPSSLQLLEPITVRIPISPSTPFTNIAVFYARSEDFAFQRLESTPTETHVDARTDGLGFFFAARDREGS